MPGKNIDSGRVYGWVEIMVIDKDGRVKHHVKPEAKNIMTNVGLAAMIRLIFTAFTETRFSYLAIGTGTTPETESDTSLEREVCRKTATQTQITTNIEGDTCLNEATFSSADGLAGSMNISEVGLFNASSGGILLARKTFEPTTVNWDAGDRLTARYYIQITR